MHPFNVRNSLRGVRCEHRSAAAIARRAPVVATMLAALALASGALRAEQTTYTEAQAVTGERLYATHCAGCHGSKLEGNAGAPALTGAAFLKRCQENGYSADDLLFIMRTFMPYNEPGKLSKQEYVEIMAHVLKANGVASGPRALSADSQALQAISFGANSRHD